MRQKKTQLGLWDKDALKVRWKLIILFREDELFPHGNYCIAPNVFPKYALILDVPELKFKTYFPMKL